MTQDRPLSRAEAQDTETPLRDAIEALSEGFAVYDADHRLVTFNRAYAEMFSAIEDKIVPGITWEDLLYAGARRGLYTHAVGRVDEWHREVLAGGLPLGEHRIIHHTDGSVYDTCLHPTSVGGFVVIRTEITEQHRAETGERERDAMLQAVLEACPVAIIMARLSDGRILFSSAEARRQFGNGEDATRNYRRPEDREAYIRDLRRNGGRLDDYQLPLVDKNGKHYTALCSGRLTEFDGQEVVVTVSADLSAQHARDAMIRRVLEACPTPIQMTKAESGEVLFSSPETLALFGRRDSARSFYADPEVRGRYLELLREQGAVRDYRAEYLNARGERFWGAVSARLIQYDGDEVIVSHTRDLTDQLRIEAELNAQREMLFQNEKMSALGELLAGVAHELNNPLSVVVGHAMMLREDATDPAVLRQAERIGAAAERCARIVRTFLTIARQQPGEAEQVSINELVRTAVDVARHAGGGAGIDISMRSGEGLPPVTVDAEQITQAIVSLILNAEHAIRASGKGSRISLATRAEAGRVVITVEDDGPGIPPAIRARIFEPFFTTKQVGEATGIGLALTHRVVHSHGGQIRLDNDHRDGSRFVISLPAAQAPDPGGVGQAEAPPAPRTRRVLVVDDEADVAELTAEILSRQGYAVSVARTRDEALALLAEGGFDAVLSDLNMPELDGRGLYEIIGSEQPELCERTGFITGDTMGRASQGFLKEVGRPYIEKPVSPRELRAFVARLLGDAAPEDAR